MTKDFLGDALSARPSQTNTKYKRRGSMATSLDGIRVDVNTTKPTDYTTTTLPGAEFERMRLYGLVLTKWSYPNKDKAAESWAMSTESIDMANRVVSNIMYRDAFGNDPTKDAVHIKPYVSGLTSGVYSHELVQATLSLFGTQAYGEIVNEVSATRGFSKVADYLSWAAEQLTNRLECDLDDAAGLHANSRYMKRRARDLYRRLASIGEQAGGGISNAIKEKKKGESKTERATGTPARPAPTPSGNKVRSTAKVVLPITQYHTAGWMNPYLAKHELVLPHTGKAGRRLIPWTEGKYPKMFYRMVSDPYRRIFQRKTRALGGVVVFDCSGSMGLSDDDVKSVMRASSGCSVVCYSGGSEAHDSVRGNIHLVARHGRQMRGLPDFPGNNGVDLPALKYAYYNLRLNSKSPVIWVSDGQVTGIDDDRSRALEDETMRFVKRKHIRQVQGVEDALHLLSQLQRRRES